MITVVSSNIGGGILQYALQLLTVLQEMKQESCLFLPEGAEATIPEQLKPHIFYYTKYKTINAHSSHLRKLAEKILATGPRLVWYVESTIVSAQICCLLQGKTQQYITVHDPALDHPTHNASIKYRLKKAFEHRMRAKSMKAADVIVLPSQESYRKYVAFDAANKEKAVVFPLGALLPAAEAGRPVELEAAGDFYLFFGRIDKYKGIANLLKAYQLLVEASGAETWPLVIAGKGVFSGEEQELLDCLADRVVILNRYIEDREMLWLIANARACMLPYVEASQSGVLPISYYYGVPVIVSNLPGLTQFVEPEKTGWIAPDTEALFHAMQDCRKADREALKAGCISYYAKHLDWKTNLVKLFDSAAEIEKRMR